MAFIAFLIALGASLAGCICGLGGGVIIKPLLDMIGFADAAAVSFLSSCTVFSMSCYSVIKGRIEHSSQVDTKTCLPLGIGAALGGICGNRLFRYIKGLAANVNTVGAIQAAVLLVLIAGTFVYTLKKKKIKTLSVHNPWLCGILGLGLGTFSSFLGVGGGPFNLVVLHFFLGQESKKAAENSLFIILLSQFANITLTLVTSAVPEFEIIALLLMIAGGIGGGIIGKIIRKKINGDATDRLFLGFLTAIILICIYNIVKFL